MRQTGTSPPSEDVESLSISEKSDNDRLDHNNKVIGENMNLFNNSDKS